MSNRRNLIWEVMPRGIGRWAVKRRNALHASSLHRGHEEAIAAALVLAQRYGGLARIRDHGGRVLEERDFTPKPLPDDVDV
jgi:hypothetical protein